jgi:CRISPR-associated protein Cas7/Cse4/CasC subtype I-E
MLADNREKPRPLDEAYNVGRYMFQKMGFKEKKERLTVMLLLGADEIRIIAKAAADNWDTLAPLSNASVLRERLADQLAGSLADIGEDAEMFGRLIANYKTGSANASALHKWLEVPMSAWEKAFAVVRQMPADLRQELRAKFNTGDAASDEEGEEDYVPKPAAALFKSKTNKDVLEKLKAIDIGAERGWDNSPDDARKKDLIKKLNNIFKPLKPLKQLKTDAVDVALFGRMIAEIKDGAMTIDAACQVGHAISTHRVAMESDYFTAVEELKELAEKQGAGKDAGAGMIGTVEFNSACYYRYANIDVGQLVENLHGEQDVAKNAAKGFLTAFVHAIPTGKRTGFAHNNPPSLVFAVVRDQGPVSLANAFVKPVMPSNGESLVEKSIEALDDFYGRLIKMYGDGAVKKSAVCWMEKVELNQLKEDVGSVDKLIETIVTEAFPAGGAL